MRRKWTVLALAIALVLILSVPSLAQYTPPEFKIPTSDDGGFSIWKPPAGKTNPLACAIGMLSTKFPFDIWGKGLPPGKTAGCPKLEIFKGSPGGIEWQFCPLLDFVAVIKYPIIIGLVMQILINL